MIPTGSLSLSLQSLSLLRRCRDKEQAADLQFMLTHSDHYPEAVLLHHSHIKVLKMAVSNKPVGGVEFMEHVAWNDLM